MPGGNKKLPSEIFKENALDVFLNFLLKDYVMNQRALKTWKTLRANL